MTETVSAMEAGKIPVWIAKMRIIRTGLPTWVQIHWISKLSLTTQFKPVYYNYLKGLRNSFRTFLTFSVLIVARWSVNKRLRDMREFM